MTEIQNSSSQLQQTTQVAPNPSSSTPPIHQPPTTIQRSPYLLALLTFILGIAGGILLFVTYPRLTPSPNEKPVISKKESVLSLPKDAIKIEECADNKGALFVRPQDIPQGPIYMVYKNKVIGLEYEIDQEKFIKGKIYKDLPALNIKVNHLSAGFVQNGHEGFSQPHSHIELYLVDAKTEQSIKCLQTSEPTLESSPSADLTITPLSSISTTAQSSPSPTNPINPSPSSDLKTN